MAPTEIIRAIQLVRSAKRFIPMAVMQPLNCFFTAMALTPREVEVLSFVASGFGNKESGHRLGTAPGTVKMHVQSILSKLNARDRTHAVAIALRRGIIHLHSPELATTILNG